MRDRKGVNSDGRGGKEELERVQGGGMVIRIEYMKKNPLSNKRKKKQVSKLSVVVYMCNANHAFVSKSNDQVLLKVFYTRDSAREGTG